MATKYLRSPYFAMAVIIYVTDNDASCEESQGKVHINGVGQ